MRIVIDTNVLWVSIPHSSPSNWIVRDLLKNDVLKERVFPKINVINLQEFTRLMSK